MSHLSDMKALYLRPRRHAMKLNQEINAHRHRRRHHATASPSPTAGGYAPAPSKGRFIIIGQVNLCGDISAISSISCQIQVSMQF